MCRARNRRRNQQPTGARVQEARFGTSSAVGAATAVATAHASRDADTSILLTVGV